MTECWINGNVRPYNVYSVCDTEYVSQLFAKYIPVLSASDFDGSEQMSGVVEGNVRYFYATVVGINQDNRGSIAVLPAEGTLEAGYCTNGEPIYLFVALSSMKFPELKIGDAICATYHGIMANQTSATWLYCKTITKLKQNTGITEATYSVFYDTILYDIDGDGLQETCTIGTKLPISSRTSSVLTVENEDGSLQSVTFPDLTYTSFQFEIQNDVLFVQASRNTTENQAIDEYEIFLPTFENGKINLIHTNSVQTVQWDIDGTGNSEELSVHHNLEDNTFVLLSNNHVSGRFTRTLFLNTYNQVNLIMLSDRLFLKASFAEKANTYRLYSFGIDENGDIILTDPHDYTVDVAGNCAELRVNQSLDPALGIIPLE